MLVIGEVEIVAVVSGLSAATFSDDALRVHICDEEGALLCDEEIESGGSRSDLQDW